MYICGGHITDLVYRHEAVTEITRLPCSFEAATRVRDNPKDRV